VHSTFSPLPSRTEQFDQLFYFCYYFYSSTEARVIANRYTTQWPDDKTQPVHVTGDMEHYLTSTAKDVGLGDFNKKDLIAATFAKENDKGDLVSLFCSLRFSLILTVLSNCLRML